MFVAMRGVTVAAAVCMFARPRCVAAFQMRLEAAEKFAANESSVESADRGETVPATSRAIMAFGIRSNRFDNDRLMATRKKGREVKYNETAHEMGGDVLAVVASRRRQATSGLVQSMLEETVATESHIKKLKSQKAAAHAEDDLKEVNAHEMAETDADSDDVTDTGEESEEDSKGYAEEDAEEEDEDVEQSLKDDAQKNATVASVVSPCLNATLADLTGGSQPCGAWPHDEAVSTRFAAVANKAAIAALDDNQLNEELQMEAAAKLAGSATEKAITDVEQPQFRADDMPSELVTVIHSGNYTADPLPMPKESLCDPSPCPEPVQKVIVPIDQAQPCECNCASPMVPTDVTIEPRQRGDVIWVPAESSCSCCGPSTPGASLDT
mmetsp:Transcript_117673/g.332926  ORF Transcript_117673/g.332926 Transcript_117673/m.332926 type:complete len:382 (-) Transcript_117673:107-1252(-)